MGITSTIREIRNLLTEHRAAILDYCFYQDLSHSYPDNPEHQKKRDEAKDRFCKVEDVFQEKLNRIETWCRRKREW